MLAHVLDKVGRLLSIGGLLGNGEPGLDRRRSGRDVVFAEEPAAFGLFWARAGALPGTGSHLGSQAEIRTTLFWLFRSRTSLDYKMASEESIYKLSASIFSVSFGSRWLPWRAEVKPSSPFLSLETKSKLKTLIVIKKSFREKNVVIKKLWITKRSTFGHAE